MAKCILENIIAEAKVSTESGQAKYRQYFIKYKWYKAYKPAVDAQLTEKGYADCIVKE